MIPVVTTSAKDSLLNLKTQRLLGMVQILGFSSSLLVILEDKDGEINKSYSGQIIKFMGLI